ncbi:helix-turn-helix domain-containing protein [Halosimplex marinum]|uniref:helix-turn-helix domain-containing protein n=1 Tax=Halosimplex marinum TaxID=3396620 RepID=UPI003F55AADB
MKRVRVTLDPHEAARPPVYERLTGGNALDSVRIENWNVATPPTAFLLRLAGDYEAFAATLASDEAVDDYELFPLADRACHCYLTGRVGPAARALFENFTRGSLLTVPPVECHDDGSSTFTIVGADADVQAAVDGAPEGTSVTVERVGGTRVAPDGAVGRLSARQREAVAAAVALGYYDGERSATCEAVAEELGCATATAAEHLRKAEAKLARAALSEVDPDP